MQLQPKTISPGQEDGAPSMILPVELFSFENNSSLREPPSLDVSLKLLQQFSVDGFLTSIEPIFIRLPD